MVKIITVEGNIGSGKSTFINKLKQHYVDYKTIKFLPEPVEEWQSVEIENGDDLLTCFYKDSRRFSFAFQIHVFFSRFYKLKQLMDDPNIDVIIMERSLENESKVFGKLLCFLNLMSTVEETIFKMTTNPYALMCNPDFKIYISTNVNECFKRVKQRNRKGEENVSVEYLSKVDEYTSQEIIQLSKCPVEYYNNVHDFEIIVEKIKYFMY
jgi:deoxyadenosine/deoxycytidine kinase